MKKIITTAAIMFCIVSGKAQTRNYIEKDTIEILTYDSLGNEYHYNPPHYLIRRVEVGDPAYWKRKHKRDRRWSRISLGLFVIGTTTMFLITKIK